MPRFQSSPSLLPLRSVVRVRGVAALLRGSSGRSSRLGRVLRRGSGASGLAEALRARKDANLGVANEVDDDHRPGRVRGDRVVELGRERTERRQPRPRHGREVVVLVVVANLRDVRVRRQYKDIAYIG